MKILFVSNIFPPHVRGGYELACLELAENYLKLGHIITVASSENTYKLCKYPDPTHLDVRRIFAPIRFYEEKYDRHFANGSAIYNYEKMMAFAGYIEPNCIALMRLIETEDPDLIWIFNPLGLGPVGIVDVSISSGKKVIIHLMEHIDNVILDYSKMVDLTTKWKKLKSQISAISCSEKILKSNSLLGDYSSNQVIYNWVNIDNTENNRSSKPKELRKISKDFPFKIVYFGQVAEKKGILHLYKLAEKLSSSQFRDRVKIDIYGKGEESFIDDLKKSVEENLKLAEIFNLKGFLDKKSLMKILSSYDLGVFLLSDDEPFAFSPLEAMSQRIPVMATRKSGAGEIFKDKYDALLIEDRKNTSEIYRKLVWCLENPGALQDIRDNAIETLQKVVDLDVATIPALNKAIENTARTKGYPFGHILSTCNMLKYPYFDFSTASLPGKLSIRYKFIDLVIDILYRLPIVSRYFPIITDSLVKYYKYTRN